MLDRPWRAITLRAVVHHLQRHWFLIALGAAVAGAMAAPDIARRDGSLHLEVAQPWLVAGIFLISGLTLPTRNLRIALGRVRAHGLIQGINLIWAPLLLVIADQCGALASLSPGLRIGALALACLPTTITSGVAFTRASGGDEALALFNATLGSLLGVLFSPLLVLALAGLHAELDRAAVLRDLAVQTILPLIIGQCARLAIAAWADARRKPLSIVSNILVLITLWHVFSTTAASGALRGSQVPAALLIAAPLFAILFATAWWTSARPWFGLDRAGRVAAIITASQKSAALGVPMLTVLASQRADIGLLCLPIVVYHVLQLSVAGALTASWQRWVHAEQRPNEAA